jgi:hypothetical protein
MELSKNSAPPDFGRVILIKERITIELRIAALIPGGSTAM